MYDLFSPPPSVGKGSSFSAPRIEPPSQPPDQPLRPPVGPSEDRLRDVYLAPQHLQQPRPAEPQGHYDGPYEVIERRTPISAKRTGPYSPAAPCDPVIYAKYLALTDSERWALPANNYWAMINGKEPMAVPPNDLHYQHRFRHPSEVTEFINSKTTMAKKTTTLEAEAAPTDQPPLVSVPRPTLFSVAQDYVQIMNEVEEAEGELTEELAEKLRITADNRDAKVIGYTSFINSIDADIEACKREEARLKATRERLDRQKTTLTNTLMFGLKLLGEQTGTADKPGWKLTAKVGDRIVNLSTRRTESIKITDEDQLPPDLWRRPPVPEMEPDKNAIKQAFKDGAEVPGAEIEVKYSLVVK